MALRKLELEKINIANTIDKLTHFYQKNMNPGSNSKKFRFPWDEPQMEAENPFNFQAEKANELEKEIQYPEEKEANFKLNKDIMEKENANASKPKENSQDEQKKNKANPGSTANHQYIQTDPSEEKGQLGKTTVIKET